MASTSTRTWRLGRTELKLLRRRLIDEAGSIDREYQRLALRMADIRQQLRELRDRIWPADTGRGFRGVRRPRIGGPDPIGRPAPPGRALRGRELRYAALGALVRAGRPLSLPEIHRALHVSGHAVAGATPVKRLADALGYEHDIGRARRVRRGVYELGELTPARRRTIAVWQRRL